MDFSERHLRKVNFSSIVMNNLLLEYYTDTQAALAIRSFSTLSFDFIRGLKNRE